MTDPNTNFSTLLSTTLNKHRDKLADNIFSARPLTYWLVDRKGRKRMESGGVKIVEPLIYAENSGFSSYSEYDRISITPQTGISAAEYEWRQLAVPVVISGIDEFKNSGTEAIINLLEAKVMQAEETMKAQMNSMLFGDGTGNSNKDWLGLKALVGDQNTSPTSVGGIDCNVAGNEFWRSGTDVNGSPTVLTEALMRTLYNSATDGGNDVPDFGVTTLALFEKYEGLLTTNMRYTDELSANLGFTNLTYKGKPIFWDGDCPAGYLFFLNSKYLTLVGGKDRWFKSTPFTSPFDSAHASSGAGTFVDARYSVITTYGQFTTNNRRKHAVGTNYAVA